MSKLAMYNRWLAILDSLRQDQSFSCLTARSEQFSVLRERCQHSLATELASEQAVEDLFVAFVNANPEYRAALRTKLIQEAIDHVDATMERYRQIKKERPLTDDEKQVGQVLLDLLSAARRLLHR